MNKQEDICQIKIIDEKKVQKVKKKMISEVILKR